MFAFGWFAFGWFAQAQQMCPDGSMNEQEVETVLANLKTYQEVEVQRRSRWLPECCQVSRRKSVGCTDKAQKFLEFSASIGNGIQAQAVKARLFAGERVKPAVFWNEFCDPDRLGAGINPGVQRSYSNGMITVHDQEMPAASTQYEKEMKAMAILLDSPNPADPLTKDRMEMYSALYYDRIARGGSDIGYEFCVGRHSGVTFEGRDLGLAGAHSKGLNRGNIGICLLGNTETKAKNVDYNADFDLPGKQIKNAEQLILGLTKQFQIKLAEHVVTHNHIQCKDCCLKCNNWVRALTGNSKVTTSNKLIAKDVEKGIYDGENLRRREYFQKLGERNAKSLCLPPEFGENPTRASGEKQVQ
jgi:hypothetical protein